MSDKEEIDNAKLNVYLGVVRKQSAKLSIEWYIEEWRRIDSVLFPIDTKYLEAMLLSFEKEAVQASKTWASAVIECAKDYSLNSRSAEHDARRKFFSIRHLIRHIEDILKQRQEDKN